MPRHEINERTSSKCINYMKHGMFNNMISRRRLSLSISLALPNQPVVVVLRRGRLAKGWNFSRVELMSVTRYDFRLVSRCGGWWLLIKIIFTLASRSITYKQHYTIISFRLSLQSGIKSGLVHEINPIITTNDDRRRRSSLSLYKDEGCVLLLRKIREQLHR